jgi:hypothetical protein
MFSTLAVTSILSVEEVTRFADGEVNPTAGAGLTSSGGLSRVIITRSSAADAWFVAFILKLFSPSRSLTFAMKIFVDTF